MIRQLLKSFAPRVLAWSGAVALSSVMAIAQSAPPATGQRSDGQIEMDVVHALDTSPALKKDLITAATIQSEVTLAGTVASDASRELAESIVAHVTGVTVVHNNLKVGNPQDAQNALPPDTSADSSDPGIEPQGDNGPMPPPRQQAPGQDQAQDQAQGQPWDRERAPDQDRAQAPPPPDSRPQYGRQGYPPPPRDYYEAPKGPVTVPQGTLIQLRTNEPLESRRAKEGTPVQFTVIQDVVFGGVLAIPRGATVHGVVTETKRAGELTGSAELALRLTSLDLGGQNYELRSDQFKVRSPGKGESTAGHMIGGALIGAIIGGVVGRGEGAAIGAGVGAGAGAAASAASPGPGIWIPAEALVEFHLAEPVTVNPVSREEAARLAQGLYPGGPTLYRRPGYYRPGYYRPAGPYGNYPYRYPPVYYRPYFVTGGYYYWR